MGRDFLDYGAMMDAALVGVVREALARVAERGLPGQHHFYITFRTGHRGVKMPDYLRQQFPDEMTIVLQHQYSGLQVDVDSFGVGLSFNQARERLIIPFKAITAFADPSVKFGLQLQAVVAPNENNVQPIEFAEGRGAAPAAGTAPAAIAGAGNAPAAPASPGNAEVVSLDAFRKK
jgi:uncharacterized protein